MGDRKIRTRQLSFQLIFIMGLLLCSATYSQAQERLCDSAFEDCRQPLWNLIDAETVGIDVAFWFMQDTSLSNKLIARHNAGVPVRVLVDPRANPSYSGNEAILNQLAAAGIPMRYKLNDGILHWKMMLFVGQNKVQFSGANYSSHFFVPTQPYQNYIDEVIYFSDDSAVVNSFKTRYDDHWTSVVRYGNYANISGPLTRRYPTHPIDPAMNFPFSADGSEDFYNRTYYHINHEQTKIDVIMYRITNDRYTGAIMDAIGRGVPVRLIHEQDEYRNPARQWDSYNVDLLYKAGAQIKWRNPQRLGLNHEKAVLLYGQGLVIFGSSNWTGPSSNSQDEHNYFTTKSWFFQWFVNHFERKWNAPSEFVDFTPLPPVAPVSPSPSSGAVGQALTTTLRWEGGLWSHKYDIYFGTNANPPLLASNVSLGSVDNGITETYSQLPPLQEGTKYYWRIVGKTMADKTASGPVWNFTTAGNPPPPSTPPTVTSVSPNTGTASGGTSVTITGTNFATGATVTFGGTAATAVNVVSATSITVTTPAHAAGAVDVVVTNSNNLSGTLANGYTYTPPSTVLTITSISPNSGTTSGGTQVTITGTNFATGATVSFDGTPATNVNVVSPTSITATTPAHEFGPVNVVVTNPNTQTATLNGGFTYTAPLTAGEIVLYASEAVKVGNYSVVPDATAAGGARIFNPDAGLPKLAAALANPTTYFEMTFNAQAGIPYRLWMRGKANLDSPYDDSVFVQFSDSVDSSGAPIDRIGTTAAEVYNLEECSGCGLSGWGWQDDGWGIGVLGPLFYFPTTGSHTIRIQVREDGLSIDQIVLSAQAYLNSSPGALKNDTTILPKTGAPPSPAPTLSAVSPNSGPTAGGTSVTINGAHFVNGAVVSIGGSSATNVSVASSTMITATTPAHAAGAVNVVVTNPDNQSATLTNGFTYNAPPAPTVSAVSPNSGTTLGGTSVTLTGTGFVTGATVRFGGTLATNVNVTSGTTITATTPAHAAGAVNVVVTNPDNQSATLTNGFTYTSASTLPSFGHVFLLVEENHSYSSVIGSSAMPYLNTLASRYGLATNYYANTQPSIGNYFWLTTGQVVTNNSNFSGTVTVDNIVRQLNASGKTWKSYAESLPSVGYTGGNQYPYVKRHNPFAYFSDVLDSPAQTNRLVPFSQFAADLANFQLPDYSFIVPNQLNNMHDCPSSNPSCTDADKLATADNWLRTNIDPLIASPVFQQDGLLVIVFDESDNSDTANGGGHIAMLVISPKAKQNFQSTTFYQHENTLRLLAEGLGLTSFPGAAAGASNMAEFFGATNTAPIISTITPNSGATDGGTSVTIRGTGFVSGALVNFGGTPATNVTVVGSTTIIATAPAHAAGAVNIVVTNPNNQSATLTNGFTYTSSAPPGETILLADDFNNNVLDTTKWVSNNVFSGFTDATVTVSETNQQLRIGPLKQNLGGSHYNGIRSATTFNFSGAYAYVEIVQTSAAATAADTMLTLGKDGNNYYRIYVEAGNLICQKKLNGAKMDLLTMPYDGVNHRFLRIRHDSLSGNVIFETAPGSSGVPGTWVQRASQLWNTTALSLSAISLELKAGTWQSEATAPGTVIFDNFKAAKP
jgi:hypothetical protein